MQKIKQKILTMLAALFLCGVAQAQELNVSGRVVDASGNPVVGASVVVKGTSTGVTTGMNGDYDIAAPSDATLTFSFLGLGSKEEAVNGRARIDVALADDARQIDEVLVVAYGTSTKQSFTGAAASVRGEKLIKGETSNVTKALEGAVAGVQIASSTGQPGSDATIRIRGLGSISAVQRPLLVVDGIPYEGSLNSIASQDIESLTVLKDAAANSMYGARGSNGVILITTKRGKEGKTSVNFEARFGVNTRSVPAYDVVEDPAQYYQLQWEGYRNELYEARAATSTMTLEDAGAQAARDLIAKKLGYNVFKGIAHEELVDAQGKINPNAKERLWNDNWRTDPFHNGFRQEYNLNVSGGTANTSAYMSLGYLNDQGYLPGSDFDRINARVKVDQKLANFLKAGGNIAYAQTNAHTPIPSAGTTTYSSMFMFSQLIGPIYPIYKYDHATGEPLYEADGSRAYDFGDANVANGEPISYAKRTFGANSNPVYKLNTDYDNSVFDNLSSRAYVEAKFLTDFTFTANFAYDIVAGKVSSYINPLIGDGKTYGGIASKEDYRKSALNANQLLNYAKKFGNSSVNVLLGHEIKMNDMGYLYGQKQQFYDPYNPELANGGSMSGLTSYNIAYRLQGYFGRAEYNYGDRYYVSGSLRRDASSRFAPDVRWGTFWSVGGAYRLSEEKFMQPLKKYVNEFKLKASYGTQGNDNIGDFGYHNLGDAIVSSSSTAKYTYAAYKDQYDITSDGTTPAPSLAFRGNKDLTWEKSANFNAGFEGRFLDRFNLGFDFFIKETNDMIYRRPLPSSMGAPSWKFENSIDMKNTGVEFDLLVNILKTSTWKWDATLNLTHYTNKLTQLPADKLATNPDGYANGNYWYNIGGSLYDWYTYQYAGVDAESGKSLWYVDTKDDEGNVTGRETTDTYADATRYQIGKSAIPDLYGGFGTSVQAYGFDLSVQTAFQLGGYGLDGTYQRLMGQGNQGDAWHVDNLGRWTENNTASNIPRLSTGDQNISAISDRWLTSLSYFSLKNVTLGYTLPRHLAERAKISALRIFLTADNLWLKSARKGFDPRLAFDGNGGYGIYSALATTSLGLTISF